MTATVTINNGNYRGQTVNGTFTMLKEWKDGVKGGFVTILDEFGDYSEAGKTIRVKCDPTDIEVSSETISHGIQREPEYVESDEDIINRLEHTFSMIPLLTTAAQKGQVTAVIVSGPGGVGKSYGVEAELEKLNMVNRLSNKRERYTIITGGCSAIGLYKVLYDNRSKGDVVVFDDCDTILWDEQCLNLLKGALDTKLKRKISWLTESRALERDDIPNDFEFCGSVIFLTNLQFDNVRSQKIAAHLGAIMSRAHYLDLAMDTRREQLLRIRQVVRGGMLDRHNLSDSEKTEVVEWVIENQDILTDLSLRTVIKCADLSVTHKAMWKSIAEETLLTRKGRMKKISERNRVVEED